LANGCEPDWRCTGSRKGLSLPPDLIRRPAPRLQARICLPSMPWLGLFGFAVMMALALSPGV
jgi:hypothetical protein